MTQTEAALAVLKAAELFAAQVPGAVVTIPDFGPQKLDVAIRKMRPKIERQADRLRKARDCRKVWAPSFIDRKPSAS